MLFSRFMELALYEPELGYYRRSQHPFGRQGDFYTAAQLQPVFGRLMSVAVERLYEELGRPTDFLVVELGAGREEMAHAFSQFHYLPIDCDRGQLPEEFTGVVFSNEFFDALPVDLAERSATGWRERRVGLEGDGFGFVTGGCVDAEASQYLTRYASPEQRIVELHQRGAGWLKKIGERLMEGFLLTIDYGYPEQEAARFPHGSLMSYRKHLASENVLDHPGSRDITSHVPFAVLQESGAKSELSTVHLQTLAQFLLNLGEDSFTRALAGGHEMQLKTLLFGIG